MAESLIRVDDLAKTFRQGFWMRKVEAVKGVSFEVRRGDIFGFLGPNGAGKTTTIKMLTGLIAPSSGSATIFGYSVPSQRALQRVGFLPENPYVYPFLTPREFVTMCGRLSGVSTRAIGDRTVQVLQRVGILYAADRQVRRLSKGMLQRTGLASALVADPELLILDEPMSGLDPVGRKEVRDLILDERRQGRTIFFSSHILSDVETLCDQVTILRKGEVVVSGELRKLLRTDQQISHVTLLQADMELQQHAEREGHQVDRVGHRLVVDIAGQEKLTSFLQHALAQGAQVVGVVARHETLEDLFVREALEQAPEQSPERQSSPDAPKSV